MSAALRRGPPRGGAAALRPVGTLAASLRHARRRAGRRWARCRRRPTTPRPGAAARRPSLGRRSRRRPATDPERQRGDDRGRPPADGGAAGRRSRRPPRRCPPTPATDGGWCSARAASGSGWSTRGDDVQRTYLVSGSVYDNLDPGTLRVYSRSQQAGGIDDSGIDEVLRPVRPRRHGAAIGFHDIPIDDGARCRPSPSSAPRCRTAASGRAPRTRSRSGASRPLGTTVVVI